MLWIALWTYQTRSRLTSPVCIVRHSVTTGCYLCALWPGLTRGSLQDPFFFLEIRTGEELVETRKIKAPKTAEQMLTAFDKAGYNGELLDERNVMHYGEDKLVAGRTYVLRVFKEGTSCNNLLNLSCSPLYSVPGLLEQASW